MTTEEIAMSHAVSPNLRFLVVGTGRSGTSFTTILLQRAGIRVDHEMVFTETGPRDPGLLEGDISWMAVPFLRHFHGPILHQVREPLAVIDSLLDLGLFAADFSDEIHRPWRNFLEQHFELCGNPLLDAMRFYVQWNARCEDFAKLRVRVEDQALLIANFADELYPGKGMLVVQEIARTSRTLNSREERHVRRTRSQGLAFEDLPVGHDRDALWHMRERYGYPVAYP